MEEDSSLGIVVVRVGKYIGGEDGNELFISVDSSLILGSWSCEDGDGDKDWFGSWIVVGDSDEGVWWEVWDENGEVTGLRSFAFTELHSRVYIRRKR